MSIFFSIAFVFVWRNIDGSFSILSSSSAGLTNNNNDSSNNNNGPILDNEKRIQQPKTTTTSDEQIIIAPILYNENTTQQPKKNISDDAKHNNDSSNNNSSNIGPILYNENITQQTKTTTSDEQSDEIIVPILYNETIMQQRKTTDDAKQQSIAKIITVSSSSSSKSKTITCQSKENGPCCATWDINTDDWWTHHPTWEISFENATMFCFSPIQDQKRVDFIRNLYYLNWKYGNCSEKVQQFQFNSGFGASTHEVAYSMLYAMDQNVPFQRTKHWPGHKWLYSTDDNSSWGYCNSTDMNCYFLPLSKCLPKIGKKNVNVITPDNVYYKEKRPQDILFAFKYVTRPKQFLRRQVWNATQEYTTKLSSSSCTTMHVRRGDSAFVRSPYRRYAAVSEYIQAAKILKGDTILLLTDDQSTIEEALTIHPDYHWIYLNRTRYRGADGGFNGHIPSRDQPQELLFILLELKLATMCDKIVNGKSGFADMIRDEFLLLGKSNDTSKNLFFVETNITKKQALKEDEQDGPKRAKNFLATIHEINNPTVEKKEFVFPSVKERISYYMGSYWGTNESISAMGKDLPENIPCSPDHYQPGSRAVFRKDDIILQSNSNQSSSTAIVSDYFESLYPIIEDAMSNETTRFAFLVQIGDDDNNPLLDNDETTLSSFPVVMKSRYVPTTTTKSGQPRHEPILLPLDYQRQYGDVWKMKHEMKSLPPWNKKLNKVFWRGTATTSNEACFVEGKKSATNNSTCDRLQLVRKYHNVQRHKNIHVDIGFSKSSSSINVSSSSPNLSSYNEEIEKYIKPKYVDLKEQLQYKYLISVEEEGNNVAATEDDLKWKLYSNSVVFMKPPSKVSWAMEDKLIPYYHYIPLAEDFSDLLEKLEWANKHRMECMKIAYRSTEYIKALVTSDQARIDQLLILMSMFQSYQSRFGRFLYDICEKRDQKQKR